jgi:hypothetical protein
LAETKDEVFNRMPRKRTTPPQILKLADDLGLKRGSDAEADILSYCEKQILECIEGFDRCDSLEDLLTLVANKRGTRFEIINDESDLRRIKTEFLEKGELAFAKLETDLCDSTYGITYRLQNRQYWEQPFVSLIDCRDAKAARSYFTKWHEVAHLLTLTSQARLSFRRTHPATDAPPDHEERLMDAIAGRFGYYAPIFHRFVEGDISFIAIEILRSKLCPESSQQAATINFVKYWPKPCLHLFAELSLNKRETDSLEQGSFGFLDQPQKALRIVKVVPNDAAIARRPPLFKYMRVPEGSVIQRAHRLQGYFEGVESLRSWTEKDDGDVLIKAKFSGDSVEALVIPI